MANIISLLEQAIKERDDLKLVRFKVSGEEEKIGIALNKDGAPTHWLTEEDVADENSVSDYLDAVKCTLEHMEGAEEIKKELGKCGEATKKVREALWKAEKLLGNKDFQSLRVRLSESCRGGLGLKLRFADAYAVFDKRVDTGDDIGRKVVCLPKISAIIAESGLPVDDFMISVLANQEEEVKIIGNEGKVVESPEELGDAKMVLVTNKDDFYGASAVMSRKFINLAEHVKSDVYILFDSAHMAVCFFKDRILGDTDGEKIARILAGHIAHRTEKGIPEDMLLEGRLFRYNHETMQITDALEELKGVDE